MSTTIRARESRALAPGDPASRPTRIVHVTDAAFSGVLSAVSTIARAQGEREDLAVELAYVPRPSSPSPQQIQGMVGPAVRVRRLAASTRWAMPALTVGLASLLLRDRPDVLQLHSSRTGMIGRALALVTGNRDRTVYSPHCFAFDRSDLGRRSRRLFLALERLGTVMGPRLVLVSDTEQTLARASLPGARTAVLSNRVDARALGEIAAAAAPPAGPDRPLRVVHVGRIAAQKRPADFAAIVRAWADPATRPAGAPEIQARWLGDGDRDLLGPGIEVSGWLDREQLHAELARADLVLFTTAGEGLPVAVLEAQALGIPVLAHDVTGMADVVVDGVTGRLCPDSETLAAALVELTLDPDLRRRYGAAARNHVRAHFDLHDLAADSLAAYQRIGVDLPAPAPERPVGNGTAPGPSTERGTA